MHTHLPSAREELLIGNAISNSMKKKERTLITKIYNDCLQLKKKGDLTEFGAGQMAVCEMLMRIKG